MPELANAVRPTTTAELAELLGTEAAAGRTLLVRGAGTASDWGGRTEQAETVVDTTGLSGIVEHVPEDMTVAVRAGTPLETVQSILAECGQRISLDPARAARGATIGGLIATADSGPRRQAFGSLRGLVIGMTFVQADGTVVRTGGHVIKNVAGYDLAKLLHGSLGTLGVIGEVVLRLHPTPRSDVTVAVPGTAAEAVRIAVSAVQAAFEPVALEWFDGTLHVRLEGTETGTEAGAQQLLELVPHGEVLTSDQAAAAWIRIADADVGRETDTVLRLGTRPDDLTWLAARAEELEARHGVGVALASSAGVGLHTLRVRGHSAGAHDELLASLRTDLHARNGTCVVSRPDGLGLGPAGTMRGAPPAGLAVMQAIKNRFDPDGRLGAGRFAPWF